MKKLSLLALIFLLASFLSVAFLRTGVYGQGINPNPPGGGGGGGGGGGVYPTRPIDNPIVKPTGEPEPDDPGPGNKYMYHCRYRQCYDPDSVLYGERVLCSPEAQRVEVGKCWRVIIPQDENIREKCSYYGYYWRNYGGMYNCFESRNLCEAFCGPWPWEPFPGPGTPTVEPTPFPKDTEVVYCKPGCRTCEICRKPNGSLCTIGYCREIFRRLWLQMGDNRMETDWCKNEFCTDRSRCYFNRPMCDAPCRMGCSWCEEVYCETRCGYNTYDNWGKCIKDCVPQCMTDFGLDCAWKSNMLDNRESAACFDMFYLNSDVDNCLPVEKGKTMCAYMCDPLDQGPAPGCEGYKAPGPTPTGVEPPPYDYWFCAGAGGCEGGYGFYPSRCLIDCGEQVCRIDEECMRTKVFPGSDEGKANCIANCHCDNPCACAAETCRDKICVDDCGTFCLGENDCGLSLIEPPKIEVGNGGMNPVNIAIDGRVHICDSQFWLDPVHQPNEAYFKVKISHAGGVDKIDAVGLGFNHREGEETVDDLWISLIDLVNGKPGIPVVYGPAAPDINVIPVVIDRRELNLKEVTFVVIFHDNFPKNLNFVWASAMDDVGRTLPWTYTDTSFKYWDCQLDFSGKLYDDSESADREVCATNGYKTPARDANFTSLSLVNVQDAGDTAAAVIGASGHDFQAGESKLIWGKTYNSVFNDDLNGDITNLYARTIDLGVTGGGVTTCFAGSQIDTTQGNDPNMPKFLADPYVDSPEIQLDYSFLQNAEPWYQVVGGGIKALGSVNNYLRSSRRMVEDSVSGQQDSGWIAAGGQFSAGNSEDYSQSGWKGERMTGFFGQKVGYNYFYNELKTKKNLGEVKSNWGEIKDTPGILFIDGNLAIDSDSSALTAGQYRIVIVKGRITVDPVVKNLAGIFIADGNITISGESNTQLVIKGMIYSGGNITLDRGFTNHRENSTRPATVVQFDPNLIFNLPPTVYQVMSGWKQGI